jgi:hypothetical protein
MVVWLWFGRQHPPLPKSSSPLSTTTPISQDPFDLSRYPSSPLNPLQVQPSEGFSAFVARLLQITMVSHSVTLVALLYIYRLKARNAINAEAGSETRPLIASLILSNKYLDESVAQLLSE